MQVFSIVLFSPDEPTANVDLNTDALIQKAIRDSDGLMGKRTVLMIAHRLLTIIDFDLILVLDDGNLVEFDSPKNLLGKDEYDKGAFFLRMVNETGSAKKLLKKIANGGAEK